MDTIRKRFLTAEQDLLLAARSDTWALADFAEHWQKLQSDWESCLHEADDDTRQLANGVASRIEELARDFSDLESHAISLEDDLLNSIEDMFASLSLEDGSEVPTDLSTHGPSGGAGLPPSGHGVASPSQWLIHNLHNPYPLPHLQFSTGRAAGSKYMKDWFAKARQRIGWTRLLRDRFAGCRSLAIDAAFRAFVRDDPNNPLDSDLKTAFSAIKTHAEFVYGNKGASSQPSQKQSRSISPTPSLTFSSSSEDSDDERSSILSPERSYPRPLKRASFDSPHTPSSKRTRSVGRYALILTTNKGLEPTRPRHPPVCNQVKSALHCPQSSPCRARERGGCLRATPILLDQSVLEEWKMDAYKLYQIRSWYQWCPHGSISNNPSRSLAPLPPIPSIRLRLTSIFSTLYVPPQLLPPLFQVS